MIIKKILIYNFKNFEKKTIIDFSRGINFLVGPNGFGKTSIFDAIELGLTGDISRVKAKNKITPENVVYNKPFFQNDMIKPVIIKVWLEKNADEHLVIVRKFYDIASNGKRDFAPQKSVGQFLLFKQDSDQFERIDDSSSLVEINQSVVNDFLGFNDDYSIEKIFNLFNYIQQEETTFFLKQSEQERSDSLSFLLKTDEIEKKIKKIAAVSKGMRLSIKNLEEEQEKLSDQVLQGVPYERLFYHKQFDFDGEHPFTLDNVNQQLDYFKQSIQDVIEFKNNFSIFEYQKKIQRDKKIREINSDKETQDALAFSIMLPILQGQNNQWQWEIYILDNMWLFEYALLENYVLHYDLVRVQYTRRNQLNQYLVNLATDINVMTDQNLAYIEGDSLSVDFENLKNLLKQYHSLRTHSSEIDRDLNDLSQLRKSLGEQFKKLSDHNHVESKKCPFCSTEFESFELLVIGYNKYKEYLTVISSQNSKDLQEKKHEINTCIQLARDKINKELSGITLTIDEQIMRRIEELKNIGESNDSYSLNIPVFKDIIQSYTKIVPYSPGIMSFEQFNQQLQFHKSEFLSKLPVENDVYEFIQRIDKDPIRQKFGQLQIEFPSFHFSQFATFNPNQKVSQAVINQYLNSLRGQLIQHIINNNPINENLIFDQKGILHTYFNNDIQALERITTDQLKSKILYLDFQASIVRSKEFGRLSKKVDTLKIAEQQLKIIQNLYEEEVKNYKIKIIEQLRIPFFIYSAKILQNYQQGLGVFMTHKKGIDNGDDKAVIKFKTDPRNDHDAIHQLSTGQLAVISLAFTLSLNTMFKLSDHLNFLMIDDPIQDMDAMNVLSFIEILRHGIIGKYQIILSTYSDSTAMFMGYKFANSKVEAEISYKNVRELQKGDTNNI